MRRIISVAPCHYSRFNLSRLGRFASENNATKCSMMKRLSSKLAGQKHNNLPSFLEYAKHAELSPTSTVYVGTHYEYTVIDALKRFGIELQRKGGRDDHGIDCSGFWKHPGMDSDYQGITVVTQCKALNKKLDPSLVRELEGVCFREGNRRPDVISGKARSSSKENIETHHGLEIPHNAVMGLLVSPQDASQGVRNAIAKSSRPMGYVKVSQSGQISQMVWNKSASNAGLDGLSIEVVHKPVLKREEHSSIESVSAGDELGALRPEIVLTWKYHVKNALFKH